MRYSVDDHLAEPQFQARISQLRANAMVLTDSRFCPRSPERQSDIGMVAGLAVVDVVRDDDAILHITDDEAGLREHRLGETVRGSVDEGHRGRLMRLHSAIHLSLCGYRLLHGPVRRIRRWVAAEVAFVELEPPTDGCLNGTELGALREWVERAVADDLTIATISGAGSAERRYWHVDGLGTVACSGTHPSTTSAVGAVDIEVERWGNDRLRISVRLGEG